ncbi:MAG: HIRAN domain-containing protein [Saprospiraceae bacterium]
MQRSDFLKVIGFGGAGLIIPDTNVLAHKTIKVYDNYIRGTVHYKFKKLKGHIKEGDPLILRAEPTNQYDIFAVEVYYQDSKIGYIAAYENIVLSNLLEQGVALKAFVSKITKANGGEIAVEVFADVIVANPTVLKNEALDQRADERPDIYRNSTWE